MKSFSFHKRLFFKTIFKNTFQLFISDNLEVGSLNPETNNQISYYFEKMAKETCI
jgi:hypothetical protein